MQQFEAVFQQVDAYVGGNDLVVTNFTGHPTIVLPAGFRKQGGRELPSMFTITGKLFGESELLALGDAFQQSTDYHRKHPKLELAKAPDTPANP
jgi:Asp-tRNA(Asn)/Glu-tRNA(Gln) amidotransferase A subunit family amidase